MKKIHISQDLKQAIQLINSFDTVFNSGAPIDSYSYFNTPSGFQKYFELIIWLKARFGGRIKIILANPPVNLNSFQCEFLSIKCNTDISVQILKKRETPFLIQCQL